MVSRILYILRFAVGLVFMLSGLLKATDAAAFANLMSDYGAEWFGYGAPLLIGIEILLGVVLIFNVRPRETAALTALFIFFVHCPLSIVLCPLSKKSLIFLAYVVFF